MTSEERTEKSEDEEGKNEDNDEEENDEEDVNDGEVNNDKDKESDEGITNVYGYPGYPFLLFTLINLN